MAAALTDLRVAPQPGFDRLVVEVVDDSIFEGDAVLFVGVASEVPFRVLRLTGPPRLVVDLARTH